MKSLYLDDPDYFRLVKMLNDPYNQKLPDLEWAVNMLKGDYERIRQQHGSKPREIWALLESRPINHSSIDNMVKDGWQIEVSDIATEGYCTFWKFTIQISRKLRREYAPEVVVHEIAHAQYQEDIDDRSFNPAGYSAENKIILEWLSKKLSQDRPLMEHIYHKFGINEEDFLYQDPDQLRLWD